MSASKCTLALLLAFALPAAPGIAQAVPTNPATQPAAPPPGEASPQAAIAAFVASINALDAVRMGRLFADGATAFFPGAPFPVRRIQGKAQVMRVFGSLFEALRARGTRQGTLAPADLAFQTWGDASIATFHLNGGQDVGRRTLVLRRIGNRWLISHYNASDYRQPAAAAPQPPARPAPQPQQPPGR